MQAGKISTLALNWVDYSKPRTNMGQHKKGHGSKAKNAN